MSTFTVHILIIKIRKCATSLLTMQCVGSGKGLPTCTKFAFLKCNKHPQPLPHPHPKTNSPLGSGPAPASTAYESSGTLGRQEILHSQRPTTEGYVLGTVGVHTHFFKCVHPYEASGRMHRAVHDMFALCQPPNFQS
jgi:hypothetical protein